MLGIRQPRGKPISPELGKAFVGPTFRIAHPKVKSLITLFDINHFVLVGRPGWHHAIRLAVRDTFP